jgi:hypothetical protein
MISLYLTKLRLSGGFRLDVTTTPGSSTSEMQFTVRVSVRVEHSLERQVKHCEGSLSRLDVGGRVRPQPLAETPPVVHVLETRSSCQRPIQ